MNGQDPPPLITGYGELPESANDCGCCEGRHQETPSLLYNRPGLGAIAYRVGSHKDFKSGMLARLSSAEFSALARLQTRDDDDFSIALLDAWAAVLDVLTYYQERFANEAFLASATELRSLIELGHLIGYRLKPGLAASTDLVFLLEESPQSTPGTSVPPPPVLTTPIPVGTRVQSVPGPDETAQIFETVEAFTAQADWNALKPRPSRLILPVKNDLGTFLQGTDTGLKVGDAIFIVGRQRAEEDPGSEWWDFRRLTKVEADSKAGLTYIEWTHGLGSISPAGLPAQDDLQIFALRKQVSLFGYNAPTPKLLARKTRVQFGFPDNNNVVGDWNFDIDISGRRIFLDALYPEFVEGSWVVLTTPHAFAEAYNIVQAAEDGRSVYSVSGRATRLTLDTDEGLSNFENQYRRTSVWGQSEELAFAETPILEPVWGDEIELASQAEGLEESKLLAVRGPRARVEVAAEQITLFSLAEPGVSKIYVRGDRLTLMAEPQAIVFELKSWQLTAPGGFEGWLITSDAAFRYVKAPEGAELVSETVVLKEVEAADDTHSRLRFESALRAAYDRAGTSVHANVAAATHGESTREILGAGDAGRPFQSFALKQSPVTHVSSSSASGSESTLELRVDDVLWHEVPFLYGRRPRERVYATSLTDEGQTIVHFGDGRQGARLPSGPHNVMARYRKGLGRQGSVGAGALSIALDKPLGLKEVFNPLPASGGDDAELPEDARRNVPVTTLTLDRLVSLKDYEDFARGFAGIANALASWTWDGESRRILVTVAGPGGAAVDPDSDTFEKLIGALKSLGDPFVLVDVKSYISATFQLKMRVKIQPDYLADDVLPAVESALREAFSFEARGFSPLVSLSEVISLVEHVEGAEAVDVDRFYRTTPPNSAPILHDRLLAKQPELNILGTLSPAEILTLDPQPLEGLEELI